MSKFENRAVNCTTSSDERCWLNGQAMTDVNKKILAQKSTLLRRSNKPARSNNSVPTKTDKTVVWLIPRFTAKPLRSVTKKPVAQHKSDQEILKRGVTFESIGRPERKKQWTYVAQFAEWIIERETGGNK